MSQRPVKKRSLHLVSGRPEEAIPHLLKNLHQSLRHAVDEALRRQGIEMSFAHFVTLFTLQAEPGIAGAELARRAFVTPQTMNTILRRLEKDGDIERRPHPDNVRADSWFITKAGQARLNRAKRVGEAVWTRLLSALKDSEVTQLQSLLARCIGGLDEQTEDPGPMKTARATAGPKRRKSRASGNRE